jgi:isocitrate dehydrogenase kinase/phosphatase
VAANIFPGDMLFKNFGITRHGKVVFYDYDEIEYITDCKSRTPERRRRNVGEIWYWSGQGDLLKLEPFLLATHRARSVLKHHADLLSRLGRATRAHPAVRMTCFLRARETLLRGAMPPRSGGEVMARATAT